MQNATTKSVPVRVRRYEGVGPLTLQTSRGEVKAYPGDHIVEFTYGREPREYAGEARGTIVTKTQLVVITEALAQLLGICIKRSAEKEAEEKAKDDERTVATPSVRPTPPAPPAPVTNQQEEPKKEEPKKEENK